jgi:O-antigen/teichoic acid export membrane protein
MRPFRSTLLADGAVSLSGAAFAAAAGLVLTALVGRGLGPTGAGLFFQMIGVFAILTQVLKLGADTGLIRTLSRARAQRRLADLNRTVALALSPVAVASTVVAGVVWILTPTIASLLTTPDYVAELSTMLRTLAPFVIAGSILAVALGGTRGMGALAPFVLVQNTGLPTARLALVAGFLTAGAGAPAVLGGWAAPLPVAMAVAVVILVRQLATVTRPPASASPVTPTRTLAKDFWSFSASRAGAASLEITLEWVDVLIIAALRSPAEAGIYAVASRSMRAGQIAEQAVRVAVSPRIAESLSVGDEAQASKLFLAVTRCGDRNGMAVLSPTYSCSEVSVLSVFGPWLRGWAQRPWRYCRSP